MGPEKKKLNNLFSSVDVIYLFIYLFISDPVLAIVTDY